MKTCSKCGKDKPLSEFYKRTRGKAGRENTCKTCRKIRMLERKRTRTGYTGKCSICGGERGFKKKYCDTCRVEKRKADRRRQSQLHRIRTIENYKPRTKPSECDTCILAIDCMYRVKRGIDPYCWDGPETNNKYFYLYERARAECQT